MQANLDISNNFEKEKKDLAGQRATLGNRAEQFPDQENDLTAKEDAAQKETKTGAPKRRSLMTSKPR